MIDFSSFSFMPTTSLKDGKYCTFFTDSPHESLWHDDQPLLSDFLHTAKNASDLLPLPMLSRDASKDVVPRVRRVRRKAAESMINKMMYKGAFEVS